MEKLKALFGGDDKALTFAELEAALKDCKDVKLANLAGGEYVSVGKYNDLAAQLTAANATVKSLQDAVKKFDGVDVDKLKSDLSDMEKKYADDMSHLRLSSAVDMAIATSKARNPKLLKAALDMSKIKLDGETVIGLNDQLTALRASDGYLFEDDNKGTPGATGLPQGGSGGNLSALSDEEYYARVFKN